MEIEPADENRGKYGLVKLNDSVRREFETGHAAEVYLIEREQFGVIHQGCSRDLGICKANRFAFEGGCEMGGAFSMLASERGNVGHSANRI